jgi:L-serine kinase (ADP)
MIKLPGEKALDLGLVPLNEIKAHEATIPALVESVVRDMHRTGFQRDPILIDSSTNIALDGMHRLAALRSFGARLAMCARYDYLDPQVKLGRWLRYLVAPSERLVADIVNLFQMKSCKRTQGADFVDSGRAGAALLNSRQSFVTQTRTEVRKIYEKVGEADRLCEKENVQIQFARDDAKHDLYSSESVYVMYPSRLAKDDIISIVSSGGILPQKTTRHTVPIRPMGVYFPLAMLVSGNQTECENELLRIVSLSNVQVDRGNTWYEGRVYSDPIAVFRKNR